MSGVPVRITPADLTVIKAALYAEAHALRERADSRRGDAAPAERRALRSRADRHDDIAGRLSLAVPGEPIQVTEAPAADAPVPADIPGGTR